MASMLYKHYLVISTAQYQRETEEWRPWNSVSWKDNDKRSLHLINFGDGKFKTAAQAEDCAIIAGKLWVDGKLTEA